MASGPIAFSLAISSWPTEPSGVITARTSARATTARIAATRCSIATAYPSAGALARCVPHPRMVDLQLRQVAGLADADELPADQAAQRLVDLEELERSRRLRFGHRSVPFENEVEQ